MCFQFLNKFFGGRRRRDAAANDGVSPRSSLANGPQVSAETVRTVKSAKSIKSSNKAANLAAVNAANAANAAAANVANKMGHSANSIRVEKHKSGATGSGGGAHSNNANAIAVAAGTAAAAGSSTGPAGDNGIPVKRGSWWGFFGLSKKKKSTESL